MEAYEQRKPAVAEARDTMKVKLLLKDPDGVYGSVKDAVQETLPDGLSEDEAEDLLKSRMKDTHEKLKTWVVWKEYVTVEIDTDTGDARVLPVKGGA